MDYRKGNKKSTKIAKENTIDAFGRFGSVRELVQLSVSVCCGPQSGPGFDRV